MINAKHDKVRRRLILTADNGGRAALADCYRAENGGYQRAEGEVAEALHEAYSFVDPADVPGALTDAPILVDDDGLDHPDSGAVIIRETAAIFWFPSYMVEDPWETLKNRGRVEFIESDPYPDTQERPKPLSREFVESHFTGGEREGVAIWIGEWSFPKSMSYDDVVKAWPELAREYEQDAWDCGVYFWRDGERFGPYSAGANGSIAIERDGGRFEPPTPLDTRQMTFAFVEDAGAA